MSTETKTLTNADAKIQPKLGVKALVQIGMLSAIAVVLMMFVYSASVCTDIL